MEGDIASMRLEDSPSGGGRTMTVPAICWSCERTRRKVDVGVVVEVYPRVCGGNHLSRREDALYDGPSPRRRGKRRLTSPRNRVIGSILAPAGETSAMQASCAPIQVHPRACGGNGISQQLAARKEGPSPRLRGKRLAGATADAAGGSIPAPAGELGITG